jgi:hypothetical protein
MTIQLGHLVYDESGGHLVNDNASTQHWVYVDRQIFSSPFSPAPGRQFKLGTSTTSLANAVSNMQSSSWVNMGDTDSVAATTAMFFLGNYRCMIIAAYWRDVLPVALSGYTIKYFGLNVSSFTGSAVKVALTNSFPSSWSDLTSLPYTSITGTGWLDVPTAKVGGSLMIIYSDSYSDGDVISVDGYSIRITV